MERVTGEPQRKRVFDLPHKLLIREAAESTKMRIVFDASTEAGQTASPSLNDCLETGPPIQTLLWSLLVRNRFKPVAISSRRSYRCVFRKHTVILPYDFTV